MENRIAGREEERRGMEQGKERRAGKGQEKEKERRERWRTKKAKRKWRWGKTGQGTERRLGDTEGRGRDGKQAEKAG